MIIFRTTPTRARYADGRFTLERITPPAPPIPAAPTTLADWTAKRDKIKGDMLIVARHKGDAIAFGLGSYKDLEAELETIEAKIRSMQ